MTLLEVGVGLGLAAATGAAVAYVLLRPQRRATANNDHRCEPGLPGRPAFSAAGTSAGRGRFAGKVAVVTGASSGLGRAIAAGLISEGANVIAIDSNAEGLAALKHESAHSGRVQLQDVVADITDPSSVASALAAVPWAAEVELLVNCAAVTALKPFLEFPLEDFQKVMLVRQQCSCMRFYYFWVRMMNLKMVVVGGGGARTLNRTRHVRANHPHCR